MRLLLLCHGWSRFGRDTLLLEWSRKHITISKFVYLHLYVLCAYVFFEASVTKGECVNTVDDEISVRLCVCAVSSEKSEHTSIRAYEQTRIQRIHIRTYRFSELLPQLLHSIWNSVFKLPFERSPRISAIVSLFKTVFERNSNFQHRCRFELNCKIYWKINEIINDFYSI